MTPISLWFMDVSGRYTELTMVYEPTNTTEGQHPGLFDMYSFPLSLIIMIQISELLL